MPYMTLPSMQNQTKGESVSLTYCMSPSFSALFVRGRPLTVMAMQLLCERGLIESLRLDTQIMARFFSRIEMLYARFPNVPYHNNSHATDVLHSVHCLLDAPALHEAFSDMEVLQGVSDKDRKSRRSKKR